MKHKVINKLLLPEKKVINKLRFLQQKQKERLL